MATGAQEKSIAGFLSDLGVTGYNGVVASIGSPTTKLVITVTQPAWAILADGVLLASELATTSITGLSTDGSYHLYLDYTTTGAHGTDFAPVWTVAATAPSTTALKVADVTVASSVISAATNVAVGLQGLPISGVTSAELTALLAAIPTTALADLGATTNITAVPGSFADLPAVQAYLAGANVVPNIETRLDNLEAKLNAALAKLRTAGIVTP